MTTWAITPIKAPEQCKTRLRTALSDEARIALVEAMLRHVVGVAADSPGVDRVFVLGPSRHDLADVGLLPDHGAGLNAELGRAMDAAQKAGVDRIIILPADLPLLTRADVDELASREGVTIASDRAMTGTNAMALAPESGFRFAFGPDSFAKHRAEIARLGLTAHILSRPTLALDIDEIEDLSLLPAALRPSP